MSIYNQGEMFEPTPWHGPIDRFPYFCEYPWLEKYKNKNIFIAASAAWDNVGDLPTGFDGYIFIHHVELCSPKWLRQQQQRINAPFYVLLSGNDYGINIPNTTFIPYTHWHYDLEKTIKWWGIQQTPNRIKYKFSAVNNRITQAKVWVTAKLLEVARNHSLIISNPRWIQDKNVHKWEHCGNIVLDDLTDIFLDKYINLELKDDFKKGPGGENYQRMNSNPWQPIYTETAVHFTNSSHHYSFMMNDYVPYIFPGPHIDEKTFKCLVAGTSFIPVAQFEVYKSLSRFGLAFDYDFDTSWDNDPGNLSRFESIVKLIDNLNEYSAQELYDKTKDIAIYNQQYILDGKFYKNCKTHNEECVETLHQLIA